jgi:hypothetical protein
MAMCVDGVVKSRCVEDVVHAHAHDSALKGETARHDHATHAHGHVPHWLLSGLGESQAACVFAVCACGVCVLHAYLYFHLSGEFKLRAPDRLVALLSFCVMLEMELLFSR